MTILALITLFWLFALLSPKTKKGKMTSKYYILLVFLSFFTVFGTELVKSAVISQFIIYTGGFMPLAYVAFRFAHNKANPVKEEVFYRVYKSEVYD